METPALERLQNLGRLFSVLGTCATTLGDYLQDPDVTRTEQTFSESANLFIQAAAACDGLANLTRAQASSGLDHGYTEADSAALATFKGIMDGFGGVSVFLSSMEFTMEAEKKAGLWEDAAKLLRGSADSAWRQGVLLERALLGGIGKPSP